MGGTAIGAVNSGRGVYDWSARDGAALLKEREEELFRHFARDKAER